MNYLQPEKLETALEQINSDNFTIAAGCTDLLPATDKNIISGNIEKEFKSYLEEKEIGMGKLLPVFRLSLTGIGIGPSLFDIAALLGKEETINRISTALKRIK